MFGEEKGLTERDRMIATSTKFKLAMARAGFYEAAVNAVSEKSSDVELAIRFQNSININRTDPWINDLAERIGISPEQLDELFRASWEIE